MRLVAGIAVLVAAGFFGYMLALLQRRAGSMLFNQVVSLTFLTLLNLAYFCGQM
ncbi:hypothetical protein HanOQP8_Chr08g0268181 [Helianthus annuus]|nr:hypothetical protein HanOQP8_Chr08g0268181 [Helianthus annuus]